MDFTYQASGGIEIFGCSGYSLRYLRRYRYREGSILFSKQKAMKGVYEKIAIKNVRFPNEFVNLYVDTLNGFWNEDEIIPYETAKILVEDYIIRRNEMIEQAVKMCKT